MSFFKSITIVIFELRRCVFMNTKRVSCICIAGFLLLSGILFNAGAVTLYVAPDGNDSWSGSMKIPNVSRTDGPFASLEGARDAIRNLRKTGEMNEPVTVLIRGGRYQLTRPFILTEKDGGTREAPVLYTAFENERVVISGGKEITGVWKPYRGGIMRTAVSEVKYADWYFRQLFINGERKLRARDPNDGDYWIAEAFPEQEKQKFKFHGDDIKRYNNLNDVEVYIYHSWDAVRLFIKELDEAGQVVAFTGPSNHWFDRWGLARYFVENALEILDKPGEWYLDRRSGTLYCLPEDGVDLNAATIVAPYLHELIRIEGNGETGEKVKYVTISGLTFTDTDFPVPEDGYRGGQAALVDPSAITLTNAEFCTIEKCSITNVGTYGLAVEKGCSDNLISRNEISCTGSGGVRIGTTDRKDLSSKRTSFVNNYVHDTGAIYNAGVGIWVGQSSENRIAHNEVHDITYSGMSIGWTWSPDNNPCYNNVIEYNHVYRVMRNANDGAGIYTLGRQMGTIIKNNIFHDVFPYHHFGWGIYLDESSSYMTVINNIVYRTKSGGTMMHGGRYNHWENNIFVESTDSQIFWNPKNRYGYGNRYFRNIFFYSNPESYLIHIAGPWIWFHNEEMDENLYYCPGISAEEKRINNMPETPTFAEWQKRGFDKNSIFADPMFTDPENDDYTLKPFSPAIGKLQFKPIDVSRVGIVKN